MIIISSFQDIDTSSSHPIRILIYVLYSRHGEHTNVVHHYRGVNTLNTLLVTMHIDSQFDSCRVYDHICCKISWKDAFGIHSFRNFTTPITQCDFLPKTYFGILKYLCWKHVSSRYEDWLKCCCTQQRKRQAIQIRRMCASNKVHPRSDICNSRCLQLR